VPQPQVDAEPASATDGFEPVDKAVKLLFPGDHGGPGSAARRSGRALEQRHPMPALPAATMAPISPAAPAPTTATRFGATGAGA
jgi:hypothetical protein